MKNLTFKHVLLGTLCGYLIKSLIKGADLNIVLLTGIIAGLIALYEIRMSSKKTIELQTQINNLIEHNKTQDKNIDDLKSSIVSVKVSSGVRGLTNR